MMAWFWGPSGGGAKDEDSLSKLDPGLRGYLEKEASKQQQHSPDSPRVPSNTKEEPTKLPEPEAGGLAADGQDKSVVPRESLFQDGRYAHLWKSYTPYSVIESRGKSDQEKLSDVVMEHQNKLAELKSISVENCAIEQLAVSDCLENGDAKSQLTLCRTENKALIRCFELQTKFLRVLGYMDALGKGRDLEDRIQVHADTLYRRMIQQEKAIEHAKREGKPPPEFSSMLSEESIAATINKKGYLLPSKKFSAVSSTPRDGTTESRDPGKGEDFWDVLTEERRKELKKRLEGMSEAERELEKAEIKTELVSNGILGKELQTIFAEEKRARLERRAQGRETVGDIIKRMWGGW